MIQNLIYLNLLEEGSQLRKEAKLYVDALRNKEIKTAIMLKFEEEHPEAREIYGVEGRNGLTVDSFDYIL